jgi:glycosyltransferase involved in cell wall biosynthesis
LCSCKLQASSYHGRDLNAKWRGQATVRIEKLRKSAISVFVRGATGRPLPNAHILIKAFRSVKTDKRLVIVGDAPYNNKYMKALKESADNRVVFTGYVFGDGYKDLSQHAYVFVLPSGVDGTRPVLLDQMGFGNCILARDSAANMEVLGEAGVFFDKNDLIDDLSKQLSYLINNPNQVKEYRQKAQERVMKKYSWDVVTEKYDGLFRDKN